MDLPLQAQVVRKKIRVRRKRVTSELVDEGGGQPAAPASDDDSGNNRAAASGAKRPHQDDNRAAASGAKRSWVPPWQEAAATEAAAKRRRRREEATAEQELMCRLQQQPAALSLSTGAMLLDFAMPNIPEYVAATTRPLRRQPLFLSGGGGTSNEVPPLKGHDVLNFLLSWREQPTEKSDGQPAALREPAQYVCFKIMELFKKAKKAYQEESLSACDESIGQASVESKREDTTNWKRQYGTLKLRRPPHLERASEVEAILKEHEGEARVWQTSREEWFPLQNVPLVRTIPSVKVGRRRRSPARIPP